MRDSGVGIPAAKVNTIFESFSQADQSTTRQFGGTGLGLTICKRLAVAMGGDIHVSSTPGNGSTFSIIVPCRAPSKSHWPKLVPGHEGTPICVLDSSATATAEVLRGYFSASGFTVVGCADDVRPRMISADTLLLALAASPDNEQLAVKVDAVIPQPVLRSDIEAILAQIARGERILQPPELTGHGARGGAAPFAPFEALVADDNAVNREVAQEALRGLGGLVTLAEDGAQALAAAKSKRFDIVFMDGSMPEMDGITAARHIRIHEADTSAPRMPIVGLTAHVVGIDAQQWRDAGMDAVLHKPFTIAELARTIERLLPHLVDKVTSSNGVDALGENQIHDSTMGAATELLDHEIFSQLIDMQAAGQSNFVHRIVGLYAENAQLVLSQIEDAVASGDAEGCARAAHSLKSMSFSIGASSVARFSHDIEVQSRSEGKLKGRVDAEALKQVLSQTMWEIDSHMTGITAKLLSERSGGPCWDDVFSRTGMSGRARRYSG